MLDADAGPPRAFLSVALQYCGQECASLCREALCMHSAHRSLDIA